VWVRRKVRTHIASAIVPLVVAGLATAHLAHAQPDPGQPPDHPLLFKAKPNILNLTVLGSAFDVGTVSDVEVADFNLDGRPDVAAAWYATDLQNSAANLRVLTIFANEGAAFRRVADIDLYVHSDIEALSVFRNGTSDIGQGDFDGDGDIDLAVAPFFGDELWFIENLGQFAFAKHLKFPFGFNSPGNFLTPPELLAADFNGDGREELACLADPIQYLDGQIVHFWKTSGTIGHMQRVYWEGVPPGIVIQWTRGLAIADFSGDGRPDLCFTASKGPGPECNPVLVFWHSLNLLSQRFLVHLEFPSILCSDVADVRPTAACPPGVLLTDLHGTTVQYWQHRCLGDVDFARVDQETGYAGLSPNRGMTAVVADVDGDGDPDLVTKQKLGELADADQIEITLSSAQGTQWTRVDPTPIDTSGFRNDASNGILRPRNLAVADLFGNTLPEIVAGFGLSAGPTLDGGGTLDIAVWSNSCVGDATINGQTDQKDLTAVLDSLRACAGDAAFNPDADLDKDGCVDSSDVRILVVDSYCGCAQCCGQLMGDADCNGILDGYDVAAFALAVSAGQVAWQAAYGQGGCDFLCVNDLNGDDEVDGFDVPVFVQLLTNWAE